MNEFDLDLTTESDGSLSVDDILSEFRSERQREFARAAAAKSQESTAVEMPDGLEDELPEFEEDVKIYRGSSSKQPARSGAPVMAAKNAVDDYSLADEDNITVDEPDRPGASAGYSDFAMYDNFAVSAAPASDEDAFGLSEAPGDLYRAGTRSPEYDGDEYYDEEVKEKPSAVSSMAAEARKYIAGIQSGFGRKRAKKSRKTLEELRYELDAETFAVSQADAADAGEGAAQPDMPAVPAVPADEPADFDIESILKTYDSGPQPAAHKAPADKAASTAPLEEPARHLPLGIDEPEESAQDSPAVFEPEYNKSEPEIDSRFNLSGRRNNTRMFFGSNSVDVSADDEYSPAVQNGDAISHWSSGEEEPVIDSEEAIGRRKLSKRKRKAMEREEMLRRQAQSEDSVAESFYDEDVAPADYSGEPDAETAEKYGRSDPVEDAFPPTFRAYLSSLVASVFLRIRGTNRTVTNITMSEDDEQLGAELSPAAASKYYGSFVGSQKLRNRISALVLLLLCYISVGLPVPGMLRFLPVAAAACCALQLALLLLHLDVFTNAVLSIFRLRFGADSLAVVSCLVTLVDALLVALLDSAALHMPLCALSGLSFYGAALASSFNTRGLRKAIRVPAIGKHFYSVTGELKFKDKQLTLLKSLRSAKGFVRRAEEAPPDETLFSKISVFILALSLILSLVLAAVHKNISDFVYIFSAVLAPAVPFTALIAFSLPFLLGTNRIFRSGAAIAGWSGLCDIGTSRSLIVTDRDLFPEGTVSMDSVRIFADESAEKVIAYAGTLVCASGSCASDCFAKLMRENNCGMQKVQELEYLSGGGIRALIDGRQILCGSTDLMRLMNVRIPYRLTDKTSVLLAIDGTLYGIFSLKYEPLPQVRRALVELVRSSRHPVFAIRDFNVNPEMLHNTFDLATDGYDFPPYVERYELSEASATRSAGGKIAAILCNEGLAPLTDVADVGRSMYIAVRINLVISALTSFLCMFAAFFKLLVTGSASAGLLLILMLACAVPVFVVSLLALK